MLRSLGSAVSLALFFSLASLSAQAASQHFEFHYVNDDDSVTIFGPWFSAPDGTQLKLSGRADPEGLCALYGLGTYRPRSLRVSGDLATCTVLLDRAGRFSGYFELNPHWLNTQVDSFMCDSQGPRVGYSRRYQELMPNDDGSYSIIQPRFGYADGWIRSLSSRSDPDGICRLFGFRYALPGGMIADGDSLDLTVVIGRFGRFEDFFLFNETYKNRAVSSIVCQ